MRTIRITIAGLLLALVGTPADAIINGTQITTTDWGFLVAVGCSGASATDDCADRRYGSDGFGMFTPQFCGGVLIRPRVVATAAHCMFRTNGSQFAPEDLYVGGGSPVLGAMTRDVDVSAVDSITVNPSYDKVRQSGDLALLVLKHEIENTAVIPFVNDASAFSDRAAAQIAGWGDTDASGTAPIAANFAEITLYPASECTAVLGSAFDVATMLCGAAKGPNGWIDACQGDSGGPLITTIGGARTLIGLTSWGPSCAKGSPGIYTRISELLPQLLQQVRSDVPVELEKPPAAPLIRSVGRISRSGTAKITFALQRDGQAVISRTILCVAKYHKAKAVTNGLAVTMKSLRWGKTYSCRAQARNAQGNGPWSKTFTLR